MKWQCRGNVDHQTVGTQPAAGAAVPRRPAGRAQHVPPPRVGDGETIPGEYGPAGRVMASTNAGEMTSEVGEGDQRFQGPK